MSMDVGVEGVGPVALGSMDHSGEGPPHSVDLASAVAATMEQRRRNGKLGQVQARAPPQ